MTKKKTPDADPAQAQAPQDRYAIRNIDDLFRLFDGGDFLAEVMNGHADLMQDLVAWAEEFGNKGCEGTMDIKIKYAAGSTGDLGMAAKVTFKPPAKPASQAAAYIGRDGQLTLFSPMMAKMTKGIHDATPHDPETGEVRDVD